MRTNRKIWTIMTVVLFTLAVCTPILQQLVDWSSTQIQLVEEVPDKESDKDNSDKKEKDLQVCYTLDHLIMDGVLLISHYDAFRDINSDYSAMQDPPPELV